MPLAKELSKNGDIRIYIRYISFNKQSINK